MTKCCMFVLAVIACLQFANGVDYLVAFPSNTFYAQLTLSPGSGSGSFQVNYTDATSSERNLTTYDSAGDHIEERWYTTSGIENKGVVVSVTGTPGEESATVFMGGHAYRILPITDLGRRYILVFCEFTLQLPEVMFIVIANDDNTRVAIKFNTDSQVLYAGRYYGNNDELQITLMKQQTFTLTADTDLTGTSVTGDKNIVVLAGTGGFNVSKSTFEQLLPTKYFGKEYVIPTFPPHTSKYRIVSDHHKYEISYGDNTKRTETNPAPRPVPYTYPFDFTTSEGVLVAVCMKDSVVIIPPVRSFTRAASLDWRNGGSTIMVVAPREESNDIVAHQVSNLVNSIRWEENPAAFTPYKYGFLTWAGSSSVVIKTTKAHSSNFFAVYSYYSDSRYTYTYNGGYDFARVEQHPDEHGPNTHTHDSSDKLHAGSMTLLAGIAVWIRTCTI